MCLSQSALRSRCTRVSPLPVTCIVFASCLQGDALRRLVFGAPCAELDVPADLVDTSVDVRSFAIEAQAEQLQAPRNVVVGAIQNAWPCATTEPLAQQRDAIHKRMTHLVEAAGAAGVQVLCLQEAWPTPFAFCTREKAPWCEFAESAGASRPAA